MMFTERAILLTTNIILGFIELIIGLRILLKLMGASTSAPFVNWVYLSSQPLLAPFEGMLPSSTLPGTEGTLVIDFSALFAFLVYALLGYLIGELLAYFTYRRTTIYYTDDGRPVTRKKVIERRVG